MDLSKSLIAGLIIATSFLGGCASNSAQEQADVARTNSAAVDTSDPRDPFEPVNRKLWDFNWDVLDAYILRPVTVTYVTVMPQAARTGLVNITDNLQEPANFLNNMFQGKVDDGLDSLARFLINTTVGLVGTFDVASKIGIERKEEQFGETLAVWGLDTGPFLMLPFLGPSDPRSFTGDYVDGFAFPMSLLEGSVNLARIGISVLETRAQLLDQEAQLEQSVDDYAFVKNAYFENLEFRVTDGKSGDKAIDDEQLDDFADFEAMLEGGDFDDYDGATEDVDEASLIEDKPTEKSEKSKAEDKSEDGNE
ncbi:surface lipoprotein [Alteromonas mediterranea]|uniref:MlaA family lipoprotein n=1 Tax=Alteromonas mediterranea TaxID=314275 RepID=UPI0009034DA3|nr:VacJ family lipoprotein [Alteromonas mediterranea]APD93244.1 surface lipoprotein [Alteromonas mediterranea]APD96871.1 surface lipoprotein [Alteromonas mediterranea]QDG33986.1 VacJ family lipoprotein [Alteromonas mediterranea]QDG37598.1 VacJ family lipoprotein [Alteromonas mediterranea]QGX60939.1 VacJ family lipoprotein [Alteromonas mediterranea]